MRKMFGKTSSIHFIGIGGSGMSGIAEVLLNIGFHVSGSDMTESKAVKHLQASGAKVFIGHEARNVEGADVVVTSTAIQKDNLEVIEAERRQIPIIKRAEMLAELMRLKQSVAIAGSHGKTTTTSLVASLLGSAGMDPTVVIGGRLNSLGSGAKLGEGDYIVAEADESDGSFLSLSPTIAVVTNIDHEHVDHYPELDDLKSAFIHFMNKVPFYGAVILNIDDANLQSVLPRIEKKVVSFGFSAQADVSARDIKVQKNCQSFMLWIEGKPQGQVELPLWGRHNILNALAAIATGYELGIKGDTILTALKGFDGIERRFQKKGERNGALIFDDYGHHPTEIKVTLKAAKERFPGRELVVLFQPHRYSRTEHLKEEFETAFNDADILLLLDIYPAGEKPVEGVSSEALAEGIRSHGHRHVEYISRRSEVQAKLESVLHRNALLLTLGAGDVYKEGDNFLHEKGE